MADNVGAGRPVDPCADPDTVATPEPYTEAEWAATEGAGDAPAGESWTGESGTVYPYDPREAYDPSDPKSLGPGGYW